MPTIPSRRQIAKHVIKTLLQQSVDKMVVFLNGYSEEEELVKDVRVHYVLNKQNMGPIVRYSVTSDEYRFVFCVDDDICFPPDYIDSSVSFLELLGENVAISYHAAVWPNGAGGYASRQLVHMSSEVSTFINCDYLGSGVSVFWQKDYKHLLDPKPELFTYEDDVWMSSQLSIRGVKLVRPPTRGNWLTFLPGATKKGALYRQAVSDRFCRRDKAIEFAEEVYFWKRKGTNEMKEGNTVYLDPKAFWARRHDKYPGIAAVGNCTFSIATNERQYQQCQDFMRKRLIEDFNGSPPKSILDLGYGLGHYARVSSSIGVETYVGLDFASPTIQMPGDYSFLKRDVTEVNLDLERKFDVVLALDVAFHITNENQFIDFMDNILRHAKEYVYITGLFRDIKIAEHVLHRKMTWFRRLGEVTDVFPWRDVLLCRFELSSGSVS